MNRKTFLALTALWAAGATPLTLAQDSGETDEALEALLRQAEFWEDNQRPDLARETLERYLQSRPDSPEVLYRLALQALQEGREQEARQWTEKLAAVAPEDPRLAELNLARKGLTVSSSALEDVRRQTRAGQYQEALAGYRELFNGDTPPRNLAPEYYQTLAGTESGWPRARRELQRLHDAYPQDQQLARSLAEVLTYREETRREGIDRLAGMAEAGADVTSAWRQALVWLNAKTSDRARYQAYLSAHPNDSAIMRIYEKQSLAGDRTAGYQALEAGRLNAAESAFRRVLAKDSKNAEARAGLGIVMLRRERFTEARDLLAQAMEAAPAERGKWLEAWQSASFYAQLAEVRQLAASQPEQALEVLRPLTQQSGDAGRSARLLEASLLRDIGQLNDSELAYRRMLARTPSDVEAQLGLIEVLRQQERWQEAISLARQLPAGAQERLDSLRDSEAAALRLRASGEPPAEAEATLRHALRLAPEDPWVRLDLARLLAAMGRSTEAEALMTAMTAPGATPEQHYAAAMLAAEQERWRDVQGLLNDVPEKARTEKMRELLVRASVQGQLERALQLLDEGRDAAATDVLQALRRDGGLPAATSGTVALALVDADEDVLALQWVKNDLAGDQVGSPGDYANHALVLARLGRTDEAETLLNQLKSDPDATAEDLVRLSDVAHGVAVIKADGLRQQGRLAAAYDELARQLREAPNDQQLLLAMARLYDGGGKEKQAAEIYDYVLTRYPDSGKAFEAALQSALSDGNTDRASCLLDKYASGNLRHDPELLLLAAQVERARGNNRRALSLLEEAQQLAGEASEPAWLREGWRDNSSNNPFTERTESPYPSRPAWLPGGEAAASETTGSSRDSLAARIDELVKDIRRERGFTQEFATVLNVRSGEDGLSQQHRLETPLNVSGMLWNLRVGLEVVPTSLHSGTPEGDAVRRFGSGALAEGAGGLDASFTALGGILDSIENTAQNSFDAEERAQLALADDELPALEQQRYLREARDARQQLEQALTRDPIYETGFLLAEFNDGQRAVFDSYFEGAVADIEALSLSADSMEDFAESREALENAVVALRGRLQAEADVPQPGTQRDAGVGLALSLGIGSLHADIGTTPLGFEETNLVGGIGWQPALTASTNLSLKLERRAVEDSVLSYAGTLDPVSGNVWGGVVRTGAGVGIGYEASGIGVYGDLAGYRYTGENVADNDAGELSFGGYYKPINSELRTLQAGIHVNAMSFDQNLGQFTYGHGGYFSPQSYLSIAYPLSYEERRGRWRYKAYLTPGYQTFSRDAADYFPTEPRAQALLNTYDQMGVVREARYAADSESGAGVSVGGNAEYLIGHQLRLGARLSYDSFGAYNEYSVRFYLINRPFSP